MDKRQKRHFEVEMESYETQRNSPECWVPGKAITAQFTDEAVLVYQAFEPKIGKYAVTHQNFEGCPFYNTKRMTWIKTNFTWMMFRSGWGTKRDQEMTLGIWLKREAFGSYLAMASTKASGLVTVRLQWDPHHDLDGTPLPERRAIQLGLKGVKGFTSGEDILAIVDLTDFVSTNDHIKGPRERLYPVSEAIQKQLKMKKKGTLTEETSENSL